MKLALFLLACCFPGAISAQGVTGVPPGENQYENFIAGPKPSIKWRGSGAAGTMTDLFIQAGLEPDPETRRHPMKMTVIINGTVDTTFDTRDWGEAFFDPYVISYVFSEPGLQVVQLIEWYLLPSKEWKKVGRTAVVIPMRRMLSIQ